MSRMVRESQVSGLRERHWFAQLLLKQLDERLQQQAPRGEALALRGAVLFHLYSALVGLVRNAAQNHGVVAAQSLLSLSAISEQLSSAGINAPEVMLVDQARLDQADPVCWLEREVMTAHGASGLARRPTPPSEDNLLGMLAEDPYAVLAKGDVDRLHSAARRVQELLQQASTYSEEW